MIVHQTILNLLSMKSSSPKIIQTTKSCQNERRWTASQNTEKADHGNLHIHIFSFNSIHSYPSSTPHTHLLIFWEMQCIFHDAFHMKAAMKMLRKGVGTKLTGICCIFYFIDEKLQWMNEWKNELGNYLQFQGPFMTQIAVFSHLKESKLQLPYFNLSFYCHAECFLSSLTPTHLHLLSIFFSSRRFQKKEEKKMLCISSCCCYFCSFIYGWFTVVSSNELWVIVDGFVQIDFSFLFCEL